MLAKEHYSQKKNWQPYPPSKTKVKIWATSQPSDVTASRVQEEINALELLRALDSFTAT